MKTLLLFAILAAICFSGKADSWIQKADFAGIPRGGAIGFVINSKGYVSTGSGYGGYKKDLWQYDPATDTWTQEADLPGDGRNYAAGFSIGTKGYLGTGQNGNTFYNDFWEYDSDSNTWSQKADFPGIKRSIAFAFSIGTKGYLGGGATNYAKEDFWEYDPLTDVWTQKANYGGGKVGGQVAFVIADKAYVGSGRDNSLAYRKDFWKYDPVTDAWIQIADFPGKARAGSAGFAIDSLGYFGLGVTIDTTVKYLHDFWQYQPSLDNWSQKSDYPDGAGDGFTGFSIDNKGYVGLGGTSGKQWWQYDTISVATSIDELSERLSLSVYPNPIITTVTISFSLEQDSYVSMELLDLSGKKMKTLLDANTQAGNHQLQLNREQLTAGIYFLQVKMNGESSVMKVVIQ